MIIDTRVSGRTRVIGIIGNPVEHSISPMLHNTISNHLGVDVVYVPLKVEKENLEGAIKGIKALNIVGVNVTIPYKKDVMKYIDDNTREALLMGAVNTIKNIDGRLYGYNTDAEGFSRSFKEESGTNFKDKVIIMIGAGGVARALAVKIAIEGAKRIYILNRTLSKAEEVCSFVNNNVKNVAYPLELDSQFLKQIFVDSQMIINTTPVGMYPETNANPLEIQDVFQESHIVYDVIYNPVKTKFLEAAEKSGCKIINGLGMLFYQGISAYEIWTGFKLNDEIVKEIFKTFSNILNK